MWFDALPIDWSWAALWYGYVICGACGGIRKLDSNCPACGSRRPAAESTKLVLPDGTEHAVPETFMGAEGRYEDYVYLQLLEREWKRSLSEVEQKATNNAHLPSARSVIVLVFWTYFETRVERLVTTAMQSLPERVSEDLLRRYASVGSRIDRLYRVLFASTYWSDLEEAGFKHVATLLQRVQQRRNEFAHGHPEAIDNALIADLVAGLKEEHESWIAVFNKRATQQSGKR